MKKKILSLALALTMALSCAVVLTGCGGGSKDAQALVGDWQTEIDMVDYFNESLEDPELVEYMNVESFIIKVDFSLREDNTYTLALNGQSMIDAVDGMKGNLRSGMLAYLSDALADSGLDTDGTDLEEMLASFGLDLDAMIDEAFDADSLTASVEESAQEGKYIVKAGKIFVSEDVNTDAAPTDEALTYKLSGDTLTLVETNGDAGELADYFPMEFTRQ